MKHVILLGLLIASTVMYAQPKPVKPNNTKALNLLKANKVAEAKELLDAGTTYEKTMNDGKTWYYRGLLYATIDTSKNEAIHGLDANAFNIALESFAKAEQLKTGKTDYFIADAAGIQTKVQQIENWANVHLVKGAKFYEEEDYKGALVEFENVYKIKPEDTLSRYYAGIAANLDENWDKAIENFTSYYEKGGTKPEGYYTIYNLYSGPKENKEKALEFARLGKSKFPKDANFPKLEIGALIDLKRIDEARNGLIEQIKTEPDNKILHFYLGYANMSLKRIDEAKASFDAAIKVDPAYFEPYLYTAKLFYGEAFEIKKKMQNLGISAADKKLLIELDKEYVEKLKVALPYVEKAEKVKKDDQEILDTLYSIYIDLDMQDQIKRIEKRYKELGIDN